VAVNSRTRVAPGVLGRAATAPAPAPVVRPAPVQKPRVKTFWCERSARARESLRRFVPRVSTPCVNGGYHNASVAIGEVDFPLDNNLDGSNYSPPFDLEDSRWPVKCAYCDYVFLPDDERQHNLERLYRRVDTDVLIALHELPPGASYDSMFDHDFWTGPDGISLVVVLPDSTHWCVDSRANNCTRKDDKTHKCWVREGDPRACNVTAGKQSNTCDAGAGSIATSKYHGFLVNGFLESC
jgi:hypothetical protein